MASHIKWRAERSFHPPNLILISEFSFQPKSKRLVKRIVPLFLTQKFFYKKYMNRPKSYFSIYKTWNIRRRCPCFSRKLTFIWQKVGFFSHAQEVKGMWFYMEKIFTNSASLVHWIICLIIAGLPRARSARGTEPHTHRLWSTSFSSVVTWLTERTYGLYRWGRGDYQKEGRGVSGVSWQVHIFNIGH